MNKKQSNPRELIKNLDIDDIQYKDKLTLLYKLVNQPHVIYFLYLLL